MATPRRAVLAAVSYCPACSAVTTTMNMSLHKKRITERSDSTSGGQPAEGAQSAVKDTQQRCSRLRTLPNTGGEKSSSAIGAAAYMLPTAAVPPPPIMAVADAVNSGLVGRLLPRAMAATAAVTTRSGHAAPLTTEPRRQALAGSGVTVALAGEVQRGANAFSQSRHCCNCVEQPSMHADHHHRRYCHPHGRRKERRERGSVIATAEGHGASLPPSPNCTAPDDRTAAAARHRYNRHPCLHHRRRHTLLLYWAGTVLVIIDPGGVRPPHCYREM